MSTAENARLSYEGGQNFTAMTALTNSGDATLFTSAALLWSAKSGYQPKVRPDGLATGGAVIPAATLANDQVDTSALTCWLAGIKTSVAATTNKAVTRGSAGNICNINSITINSSNVITVVAGTAAPTFSETRGAAGGPPFIPVGSIEIAQVRLGSITAAKVLASEIFAVPGIHTERYDFPFWTENNDSGSVTFASALPLSHTAGVPKKVYASFSEPIFVDVPLASDFVPPETSNSVSSTQVYGTTLGSSSSSLGQGAFTAYLSDGIGDPLVSLKNQILWFKFFPDRYQSNYILTQGKLGINRTYPANNSVQAKCTITASIAAKEVVV